MMASLVLRMMPVLMQMQMPTFSVFSWYNIAQI